MAFKTKRLGDVLELRRGFDLPGSKREKGVVPVYSSSGISGYHSVSAADGPCLITGRYGTIGQVFYSEKPCWPLNTSLYATDFKGNNPRYLYYLLKTLPWENYATASAVPGINRNHVNAIPVHLPDLECQTGIASILGALDGKIALNSRLNGYLEELFDLAFKRMLEHATDAWVKSSLLDIAQYKNGLAMQKFRPMDGDAGLPVLKIRELGQGACGPDSERCSSDIEDDVIIHDGDLVFSWSGTLLLAFWAGGDAGLNQHLFKVTSEKYPKWLYYGWTKHHLNRFIMLAKDRATTMGHIKRSALAESEVLLPPSELLEQLTKALQPIIDLEIAYKTESKRLANLRDTLLPKLMSGEIDVSKVDLTQLNSHLADC